MEIDVSELQVILLPGKCPPKQHLDTYLKAYNCWREVWEETYKKELKLNKYLTSDDFTRQDEILALFHKGECTALVFFKWVDSSEDPVAHDSYFKVWPELALRKLSSRGPRILVCSQFTVHSKYRRNSSVSWKDLLIGLLVERFRFSDCDAMTGVTRLQRNMGEATYRSGAEPLMKGIPFTAEDDLVDLVGFFHDKIIDSPVPGIHELVAQIFPKVIALVKPVIKHSDQEKRAA